MKRRDPYDDSGKIIVYLAGLIVILMMALLSVKVVQDRQFKCELDGGTYSFDSRGGSCALKYAVVK